MADDPLAACRAKLTRAREHLKRLRTESARFLKTDPYRLVVDFDAQSGWYFVKARIVEEAPVELSVTVGEFAYECVSALNHAAWQLAGRKRGRVKIESQKLREQIQFPVALSRESFKQKALIKHRHVSKAAVAVINELQPCYRFDALPRAKMHPLAILKQLADSDKHRVVAPTWGSIDLGKLMVRWDPSASEPESQHFPRKYRTLGNDAKVMKVRFGIGNDIANVYVDGDLAPEIAFGAGDFLVGPRDLDHASGYMGRAIDRLATLFPSGS
jgi:hypothetical protein